MRFKAAVLGSPISHSLSPTLHTAAYEILGIDAEYSRFEVMGEQLAAFLEDHQGQPWRGFSLTMPLKESVFSLLASCDRATSETGSANTVIWTGESWSGYNTDVLGFEYLIADRSFESVSILGAGGTAKAALYALRDFNLPKSIYRRDSRRDAALQQIDSQVRLLDWSEISQAFDADLLINAAPAQAAPDYLPVARPVRLAIDALYSPWPPPLMNSQAGGEYISGKELLVAQGMEQVALFGEVDFDRNAIFGKLLEAINPQR